MAYCSKRGEFISQLEGCGWFVAPNVRNFSRVWRVLGCVLLQMRVTFLAFGAFGVAYRSKRAQCCAQAGRHASHPDWRVYFLESRACSSVDRASASGAEGRGFESH